MLPLRLLFLVAIVSPISAPLIPQLAIPENSLPCLNPPPHTHPPQLRSLSLEHRLALAWRVRSPAAAKQAAGPLVQALHASSLQRQRSQVQEEGALKALATAFTLERRAAELDLLGDG